MASIDPRSGFCSDTRIFHSLRPRFPLPPETAPISVADFIFSILAANPPPPPAAALIDAETGRRVLFPELIRRVQSLAQSLVTELGLGNSAGDTAFVLSPNTVEIPILYLALLSLGVSVSPSNPANTAGEISRQIELCRPIVVFATSDAAAKIAPPSSSSSLRRGVILIDSPEFESMMMTRRDSGRKRVVTVRQSDTAAILFSSGTTGTVKGVALSHRNWISVIGGVIATTGKNATSPRPTWLCAVPYFHVYGFGLALRTVAQGQTLVAMGRGRKFDVGKMVRLVDDLRISHVAVAPPVVVSVAKNAALTEGRDLSCLHVIACSGAPLRKSVIQLLRQRLPHVQIAQAYGLTESTGRVFGTVGPEESRVEGAVGKLVSNFEAKIVDPGNPSLNLPPTQLGELCLKGPFVMKCYVGDNEATASSLDSEGWLKTGDLCYIDTDGFLFVVDRLKELIKYKGFQVAPAELEHLLQSHPDIAEATVVPYADEEAGQVPMAFVVKCGGSNVSESQIMDFVAKQVAPYKKIRKLRFIDAIPKNEQGKVLRRELVKLAFSNPASKL